MKACVGGHMHPEIKVESLRELCEDKECADVWSAAFDHDFMLKLVGHSGISIHMYFQEGFFSNQIGKRKLARHALFF